MTEGEFYNAIKRLLEQTVIHVHFSYEKESTQTTDEENNGVREELLMPEDVIQFLGISPTTLYRLCRQGLLKPVWVGGQRRFRKSDIDFFINH